MVWDQINCLSAFCKTVYLLFVHMLPKKPVEWLQCKTASGSGVWVLHCCGILWDFSAMGQVGVTAWYNVGCVTLWGILHGGMCDLVSMLHGGICDLLRHVTLRCVALWGIWGSLIMFCNLVFQQHLQPVCLLQIVKETPPQPVHIGPSSQTSCLWHPTTLTGICQKWHSRWMLRHLWQSETAFPSAAIWRKGTKTSHRGLSQVNRVGGWPDEHHWRLQSPELQLLCPGWHCHDGAVDSGHPLGDAVYTMPGRF